MDAKDETDKPRPSRLEQFHFKTSTAVIVMYTSTARGLKLQARGADPERDHV